MKRGAWCVLLFFITLAARSQQEQVFKVKAKKFLVPYMDTLVPGNSYHFKLAGITRGEVAGARFSGGKVTVTDSGILITIPGFSNGGRHELKVLTYNKDSLLRSSYKKSFTVLYSGLRGKLRDTSTILYRPAKLVIYWGSFDNALLKKGWMLKTKLVESELQLLIKKDTLIGKIQRYKLVIKRDKVTDTFTVYSNRLTEAMRDTIKKAPNGSIITLYDVRYTAPGATDIETAGPFEIVVVGNVASPNARNAGMNMSILWGRLTLASRVTDSVSSESILDGPKKLYVGGVPGMVKSFEMVIACNGQEQVFRSQSASFTMPMLNALKNVSPGCTVKLPMVSCSFGPSDPVGRAVGPFEVAIK